MTVMNNFMRNVTTGGMETTLQSEFGNLLLDLVPLSCELQAFMNSRVCEFIAELWDDGETSASMSQAWTLLCKLNLGTSLKPGAFVLRTASKPPNSGIPEFTTELCEEGETVRSRWPRAIVILLKQQAMS